MLATQLNDSVNSGELCKFAVIRIEKYNSNTLPQDRCCIIYNICCSESMRLLKQKKLREHTRALCGCCY